MTIFAHAHLGLSSYVAIDGDGPFFFLKKSSIAVAPPIQNQNIYHVLDKLVAMHNPMTHVLLVGHHIEGLVNPRSAKGTHHIALTYMLVMRFWTDLVVMVQYNGLDPSGLDFVWDYLDTSMQTIL